MYNPVSITISANSHGVHFVAQIYSLIEYFCPNRIKSLPFGLTSTFVELCPFSFFLGFFIYFLTSFFWHRFFFAKKFCEKKYFHSSNVYNQVKCIQSSEMKRLFCLNPYCLLSFIKASMEYNNYHLYNKKRTIVPRIQSNDSHNKNMMM